MTGQWKCDGVLLTTICRAQRLLHCVCCLASVEHKSFLDFEVHTTAVQLKIFPSDILALCISTSYALSLARSLPFTEVGLSYSAGILPSYYAAILYCWSLLSNIVVCSGTCLGQSL
jgi:hypothetical protein